MFNERTGFKLIKIDNSKEAAISGGTWKDPGANLYDELLNAVDYGDSIPEDSAELDKAIKSDNYKDYRNYLKEAYLVAPVEKINNTPYGVTPYSNSGCKYPHHVIKNDKLVIHIKGLQAAYARAKQMNVFKGDIKEHLERHYKELELESNMKLDEKLESNFASIEKFISENKEMDYVDYEDDVYEFMESLDDDKLEEIIESIINDNFESIENKYVLENSEFNEDKTYNTEEKEFVPVYIIVKSGNTFFAKVTKFVTGDSYSHALVSFDDSFEKLYSFNDDGLEIVNIYNNSDYSQHSNSLYFAVAFVTKQEKSLMMDFINHLINYRDETSYANENLLEMLFNFSTKADKRFVCSTLCGYLLSMGNFKTLHKDFSKIRPEDLTILPRVFYIMNTKNSKELMNKISEFKNRVKSIYKDNYEEINDYNNILPRLLLQRKIKKLKLIDKFFNNIINAFVP